MELRRGEEEHFRQQGEVQVTVLNYDDPIVRTWGAETKGRLCYFSRKEKLQQGIYMQDGNFIISWTVSRKLSAISASCICSAVTTKKRAGSHCLRLFRRCEHQRYG